MIDAIVYTSNTGHTKEYAEMLSQKLNIPVFELKAATKSLQKNSQIIYLGWLMAGTVKGYKKAVRRFDIKALCGVGMAENGTQYTDVQKANKIPSGMPVFTLQGGFEIEKLHGIYKLMMTVMKKTVGKGLTDKKDRTEEEEQMLSMMINGENRVSEEKLREVIDWYNSFNKQ